MRTTSLSVHNDQILEIFIEPREEHPGQFLIWMVGDIKGQRTVLDHLATQDDLEQQLSYIRHGDMIWKSADKLDIPLAKNQSAIENEKTIEQGALWDHPCSLCWMATIWLPISRKTLNAAKKLIIGEWSDGVVNLSFKPNSQFHIDFPAPPLNHHPLLFASDYVGADRWNLSRWLLFLMNDKRNRGYKIGGWKCDEHELHIFGDQKDVLVHPLRRVG